MQQVSQQNPLYPSISQHGTMPLANQPQYLMPQYIQTNVAPTQPAQPLNTHKATIISNEMIKEAVDQAQKNHLRAHILGGLVGTLIGMVVITAAIAAVVFAHPLAFVGIVLAPIVAPLLGWGAGEITHGIYERAKGISGIPCHQIPAMERQSFEDFIQASSERAELLIQGKFSLLFKAFAVEEEIRWRENLQQKNVNQVQLNTNAKIEKIVEESTKQIQAIKNLHTQNQERLQVRLTKLNGKITEKVKKN